MIPAIDVKYKEKGAVPRKMRKVYTASSKVAWYDTGIRFHGEFRDKRFSVAHARKAGYKPRRGEEPGLTQQEFFRSYTGRKLKKFGHRRPLEFSGETRRNVRSASISSTSKGSRVRYPGARKLNFRNPHSDIRMAEEFRKLLPDEITDLAQHYDRKLDHEMNADNTTETRSI